MVCLHPVCLSLRYVVTRIALCCCTEQLFHNKAFVNCLQALSWAYVPASRSLRTFEGWKTPASTDMFQQIVIIGGS